MTNTQRWLYFDLVAIYIVTRVKTILISKMRFPFFLLLTLISDLLAQKNNNNNTKLVGFFFGKTKLAGLYWMGLFQCPKVYFVYLYKSRHQRRLTNWWLCSYNSINSSFRTKLCKSTPIGGRELFGPSQEHACCRSCRPSHLYWNWTPTNYNSRTPGGVNPNSCSNFQAQSPHGF